MTKANRKKAEFVTAILPSKSFELSNAIYQQIYLYKIYNVSISWNHELLVFTCRKVKLLAVGKSSFLYGPDML